MHRLKLFIEVISMVVLLGANICSGAEEHQTAGEVTTQMSMEALATYPERHG
jgi:hypothetical protein